MRKRLGRRQNIQKPRQQNPKMEHDIVSTGNKLLDEASPFDQV